MSNASLSLGDNGYKFDRHEYVNEVPGEAIPCITILVLASVVGTFGNLLILTAIIKHSFLQNLESIFIVNLAISDMYVTAFAAPMGIVAKVEGYKFLETVPKLCPVIAYFCTMACINSLGTIAVLSFNRYINICHYEYYNRIFKKHTCVMFCMSLWLVGLFLVLLNQAGIGDHSFDHKSLECIWDRMATYSYTVFFSVTLVWVPIIVIGFSYLNLYRVVHRSRKRTRREIEGSAKTNKRRSSNQLFHSLIVIYAVFAMCWIPYALIIVIDTNDTFSYTAHVYVTMCAHLHPSINWLVYYRTHKNFRKAFNNMLHIRQTTSKASSIPLSSSSKEMPSGRNALSDISETTADKPV